MTSRELLAAAHRAMAARHQWEEAQAALRAPDLHPTMRERARARTEAQFHAANDRLALVVFRELGIDGFSHVLARALQNAGEASPKALPSATHNVNRFARVRVTKTCGTVTLSPKAGAFPTDAELACAQRVRSARAAYLDVDARDVRALGLARSAYLAALVEYFDLRDRFDNEESAVAE